MLKQMQSKHCKKFGNRHHQISNISCTKSKNLNIPRSSCSCFCPVYWSQVLSREWRWQAMLQLQLSDQRFHCLYSGIRGLTPSLQCCTNYVVVLCHDWYHHKLYLLSCLFFISFIFFINFILFWFFYKVLVGFVSPRNIIFPRKFSC